MSHNKPEPIIAQEVSPRKVALDELSDGFRQLGIIAGDSVMLHASLDRIGDVDGGAAMVLHKLLGAIGKRGTLLMPTFTSITRHSGTHDNFTKPGCWCEGSETRHLPFVPDLQPDKTIGAIAHRLCSWPSSRRSNHPAYSFVAVGAGAYRQGPMCAFLCQYGMSQLPKVGLARSWREQLPAPPTKFFWQ